MRKKSLAKHARYFSWIFTAMLLNGMACSSFAQERANTSVVHYGDKEEGWFWYKDPKEEKQKIAPPPPIQKKIEEPKPPEKPEKFSLEWLKEQYPKLRDKAIEDPSDDNMRAFLYSQRIIMDKAQTFANAATKLASLDPLLDENNRIPISSAAKALVARTSDKARDDALKHMSKISGIWFFFDSTCKFCSAQYNYMKNFTKEYAFIVKNISMDGKQIQGMGEDFVVDRGQAKMLNVQIAPTTVLVVPPNGFYIVSQGLNSVEGLGDKILMAAEANNLIPKELVNDRHPFERGVLKREDLASKQISDDPKEWVRFLQEKIGGRLKN